MADIQIRTSYRKATGSKDEMGLWSATLDAWRTSSANTGVLTPSLSSDMWVQPGLQYALSTAGSGTANVAYVLAAKRS